LELGFEFVCPFIIREGAFYSNKVKNLLASTVVADVSPMISLVLVNYASIPKNSTKITEGSQRL
jgi:hypothetical protein